MTDIWFRNPFTTMGILASEGVARITWTRQELTRHRTDGIRTVRQFYMHTSIRPKIMCIGIQGTSEYTIMDRMDAPRAVYPAWSGKNDSWDDLLDYIEKPWGEDMDRCTDLSVHSALRPIFGQKHRVIITNPPSGATGDGFRFWTDLARVQEDYPEVELFVNGTGSLGAILGMGFSAADFGMNDRGDPNDVIYLPNGMRIELKRDPVPKLLQWEDWIKTMGFSLSQLLNNQEARYRMRIRSIRWAAKHWRDNYQFSGSNAWSNRDKSDDHWEPNRRGVYTFRRQKITTKESDKVLCNRCTLAPNCKAFRIDSICGLKDSKVGDLEKFFQSRSAGKIIDGLAEITKLQARRLENAIDRESEGDKDDPEVTKQMNSLFTNGVKLAKLVDPDLNGKGTNVQVNVGMNGANVQAVAQTNPKELVAEIVFSLENNGIPRDQITPKMIEGVLIGMGNNQPAQSAIEAQVLSYEEVMGKTNSDVIEGTVTSIEPQTSVMELLPLPIMQKKS